LGTRNSSGRIQHHVEGREKAELRDPSKGELCCREKNSHPWEQKGGGGVSPVGGIARRKGVETEKMAGGDFIPMKVVEFFHHDRRGRALRPGGRDLGGPMIV